MVPPAADEPGRWRRTFASLRVPTYRQYFVGNLLSLLGFWIRIIVQGWLVYALTDSKDMLGLVTAIGLLPFVVFSPLGGLLGDRMDRRRLLMAVPFVSVAANLVLAWLVISDRIEIWHILATAALIGSSRAIEIPVRNAFVRDLVGLDDLPNAVALNAATFNLARVVGPSIAGVLFLFLDLGECFIVAAVLNAAMVGALWRLPVPRTVPSAGGGTVWRELAEGALYVRGHRRTRTLLLLLAIALITMWAYQTLMPAFAKDQLGLGKGGFALLMGAVGCGALAGALVVAGGALRRKSGRKVVFGLVWTGAGAVFLLGQVGHVALAVPLLVVAGFSQVAFIATANGMVQMSVPDALRGRVMGLWTLTFGGCFPIGSLIMGRASEALSLPVAWSGGAVVLVVLSVLLYLRLPPRHVIEAEQAAERARLEASDPAGLAGPAA